MDTNGGQLMTYQNPLSKNPSYIMTDDVPGWEQFDFDDVTRVEVITSGAGETIPKGRKVVDYGTSRVTVSIQDDGRTLKLFYDEP